MWWSSKRGSFGSVNDQRTQTEFALAYKLPFKIEYSGSMQEVSASSALSNNLWGEWQRTAGQHLKQSCSSFSVGLKMMAPLTCISDK